MSSYETVPNVESLRWQVIAIMALSFVLRLLWVLWIPVDPVSDSFAYQTFATNIADHGIYGWTPDQPGAYWAVGTPAIYAAGYLIFGTGSPMSVVIINMISSLAATWLLYDLGRRWFSERAGQIAALLFAIWPLAIQFTSVIASEIHFMALTLAALAAWDRGGLDRRGLLYIIAAGVFLAAATYVRPIALLIPAALAIAAVFRTLSPSWRIWVKAAVVTAMVFLLVAPWSARNERVFGEPVFMSTNFWANFWMGNNPETTGEYMPLPDAVKGMTETERSHYLEEISRNYLQEAPVAFVMRTTWKAIRLHERETIGVGWNKTQLEARVGNAGMTAMKAVSTGYWYLMLAAAFGGIYLLARQEYGWRVLFVTPLWLWLYFTGVHAVIVVGDRYHMPAIPMIALLAAVSLAQVSRRFER